MALARKIDKAKYDGLSADLKAEYKVSGSNPAEYLLDTEGDDDAAAAALRARDNEKALRVKAEKDLADLKAAGTKTPTTEPEPPANDPNAQRIAKLEKQLAEEKAERIKTENAAKADKANTAVAAEAKSLAAKLAGKNADLLLPHIERRLKGEVVDGVVKIGVIDKDGVVGSGTIDDLSKEMLANKSYAAILIGSKATGGGAGKSQGSGGSGSAGNHLPKPPANKSLADYSPEELVAHRQAAKAAASADA